MALITKAYNAVNSFFEIKKGEGLNANIAKYLDIMYATQACICVEVPYCVRQQPKTVIQCI